MLKQKRLRSPVVSVGNLSTGGGGKTPFVIALATLLRDAGMPVDVLSRGYGRSGDNVEQVDPSPQARAEQFGDEPLLIARETGVPVYVGAERYTAGLSGEAQEKRMHLLDDGFQHRRLARDLDIVLLHRDDLSTRLLPAGHLREPLSSLRRADVVVLREEDRALVSAFQKYLKTSAVVWHVRRTIQLASSEGAAVAFCGIARPEEFFSDLRNAGAQLGFTIAFPDHHPYTDADLRHLCDQAKQTGAARFLTTAKDFARLRPASLAALQPCAPVESVPLAVTLLEAEAAIRLIKNLQKTSG